VSARQHAGKPRVLAFADGRDSLVAACRVHAPLRALQRAGLIGAYVVTDATLRGAPASGSFDVVWLQRGADAWLARALAARLEDRYLLDLDDHLLCRPTFLEPWELPDAGALTTALGACRVLTTPSARLVGLLERRAGLALAGKARTCRNAVEFGGTPGRAPSPPTAILLTQGHRLALMESAEEVLGAISVASARHGLPIWSLGALPEALRASAAAAGATLSTLVPRTWAQYHAGLAAGPALLGVAPLETRGDPATNEFVAGKSDVKMVEFGGFGHPAVYSRAAPYVDTDLACGRLADNDAASWTAALDELCEDGWRALADEQRAVREKRDLAQVSAESWLPAIRAAQLTEPVDAARLLSTLDRLRARAREEMSRARWHLRPRRAATRLRAQT
jgi:hypothetical protein